MLLAVLLTFAIPDLHVFGDTSDARIALRVVSDAATKLAAKEMDYESGEYNILRKAGFSDSEIREFMRPILEKASFSGQDIIKYFSLFDPNYHGEELQHLDDHSKAVDSLLNRLFPFRPLLEPLNIRLQRFKHHVAKLGHLDGMKVQAVYLLALLVWCHARNFVHEVNGLCNLRQSLMRRVHRLIDGIGQQVGHVIVFEVLAQGVNGLQVAGGFFIVVKEPLNTLRPHAWVTNNEGPHKGNIRQSGGRLYGIINNPSLAGHGIDQLKGIHAHAASIAANIVFRPGRGECVHFSHWRQRADKA